MPLTDDQLSNLIAACATSRLRDGSPEWQSVLDHAATVLRDERAALDSGKHILRQPDVETIVADVALLADWLLTALVDSPETLRQVRANFREATGRECLPVEIITAAKQLCDLDEGGK